MRMLKNILLKLIMSRHTMEWVGSFEYVTKSERVGSIFGFASNQFKHTPEK